LPRTDGRDTAVGIVEVDEVVLLVVQLRNIVNLVPSVAWVGVVVVHAEFVATRRWCRCYAYNTVDWATMRIA
jgi:hypothetical protein